MPVFEQAQAQYPGIAFVMVNQGESAQQARAFLGLQREHLRLEDTRLMPHLEALLSPAVLDAAAAVLPGDEDPVFGAQRRERFLTLFERLRQTGPAP